MHIRRSINRFSHGSAVASAVALQLAVLLFFPPHAMSRDDSGFPGTATSKLEYQKLEVETNKLRLEAAKLREENAWIKLTPVNTIVLSVLLSVLATAVTAVSSFFLARFAHGNALDQATHGKRLEHYPALVSAGSALAIYFPQVGGRRFSALDQDQCRDIGRAMSRWYFRSGGLLMGSRARNAYFDFVRALTRASSFAGELAVPRTEDYAEHVSVAKLGKYRDLLRKRGMNFGCVEKWEFGAAKEDGSSKTEEETRALEFKDYVFLQEIGSRLRTALAEDIRSRQRLVVNDPVGS